MWSVEDSNSRSGTRLGKLKAIPEKYHAGFELHLEKHTKIASSSDMDPYRGGDFTMQRARIQRKWEVLPGKNQVFDFIHIHYVFT